MKHHSLDDRRSRSFICQGCERTGLYRIDIESGRDEGDKMNGLDPLRFSAEENREEESEAADARL
jgi:hypothetical protein